MWFVDLLFGRKRSADLPPPEDAPLPPMRLPPFRSAQPAYVSPPVPRPMPLPADAEEYWMDYSKSGEMAKRRRIVFLLASPGQMVTGIDLEQRRVRTYRLDRMGTVTNPRTQVALPAAAFFAANPVVRVQDWTFGDRPEDIANKMLQQMVCQILMMVLVAQAGAGMTPRALDAIMDYIQRDNRFAVRADFVPKGDKSLVWPILRGRVLALKPRRDHLLAYVETLNENWDNSRRFTVLNDAVTALCHIDGGPTDAQRRLAMEVEAAGK
jgi:hypothetical protein